MSDRQLKLMISLFLIFAIIIAYGQVRNFDFVDFDDGLYITENIHVQKGLTIEGLIWAFTSFHAANWHPMTWFSHMLDCELYGLNPMGHHWTNIQLHMANTLLLFLILQMMTGAIWRSAFVAGLFALHPLHVESVAWVAERKDVLSTFFWLLTMLAYLRYVKKPVLIRYFMVLLFFVLGLMSKPMLVTLPFVLLLLDLWPLGRFRFEHNRLSQSSGKTCFDFKGASRLIVEKIPFFILVVISCSLTFFAQKGGGALVPLASLSLKPRIANALISYVSYVFKAIWPGNLAVYYPYPADTFPVWQICGAALLIVSVFCGAICLLRQYRYVAVGLFWYFGTLIPVIGLVQVSDQAMADRYTYIPLTGLFITVAWGVSDLLVKWRYQKIFLGVSAVIILSALTVCTFFQASHWRNTITLFENAVKVTENNYKALNNLGAALIDKGKPDEALLYFAEALRINPQKTDARNNLANVLSAQGKLDEAVSHYKEAIRINPEHADAHYNLANVLSAQRKLDEAVLHYKEAIEINPEYAKAYYHLGNILINQKKVKEAMFHFAEAIRINPDYAEAYNKIGLILAWQGKYKKAKVFFLKAIQVRPNYMEARKNIAILEKNLSSQ
ncbi:MAG: tetratricopeptide repeat protein [Candidatus Aminicenantes bacterium]|nr:tetratricopeptide repeat protein [Candidatus Aminicenantes bacterium]